MLWALAGGALASGAGSYLGGIKKTKIDPYGSLNPEQKALVQQIGPNLQNKIGANQRYSGNYTAEMSPEEQAILGNTSRLAAMNEDWASKYQPGYIDPEVDAAERKNLNDQFYGADGSLGVKDLVEEQYGGIGGYWGGERPRGVMNAYNATVTTPYQNWRSDALQKSYQNALDYSKGRMDLNTSAEAMLAIPREIKQYGLDKEYTDWVRAQEADQKYIDQALYFLGISTGTVSSKPKYGVASAALSGIGSALSSYGMGSLFQGADAAGAGGYGRTLSESDYGW